MKKGIIVVNAFLRPKETLKQAERLKNEFASLGAKVDIVNDCFLKSGIINGNIHSDYGVDFVVFLDKDKYQSAILSRSARLFNGHEQIRVCDDKGETYLKLALGGFALPDTVFAPVCYSQDDSYSEEFLMGVEDKLGYPMIVKESYGSMGKGVYIVNDRTELKAVSEKLKNKPFLFQKFISSSFGKDVRVTVIGGKAKAVMMRENKTDFRSNVSLGGTGKSLMGDTAYSEYLAVAEKVAAYLGLDYAGVDLLIGENNKPVVCEVNSNAFFFESEKATGVNIAKLYAEYIMNNI